MATSHHGDSDNLRRDPAQEAVIKRLMEQLDGTAHREYPQGRMGHEDDGALSYAVTADKAHKVVVIRFGKPVEWIGLGPKEVNQLINMLKDRCLELGEIVRIEG